MMYAFKLQKEGANLKNARKFLLFHNLLEARNALKLIGQAFLRSPQTISKGISVLVHFPLFLLYLFKFQTLNASQKVPRPLRVWMFFEWIYSHTPCCLSFVKLVSFCRLWRENLFYTPLLWTFETIKAIFKTNFKIIFLKQGFSNRHTDTDTHRCMHACIPLLWLWNKNANEFISLSMAPNRNLCTYI